MAGLFGWHKDWWRQGAVTVTGDRVAFTSTDGLTAVNESAASPITDQRPLVMIRYRAPEPVDMRVYYTQLRGQSPVVQKRDTAATVRALPAAATTNTVVFNPAVPLDKAYERFRIVARFNKPITIEEIQVAYDYVDHGDDGVVQDGEVRSYATVAVQGGPRPQRLTAGSQAGDTALLFVSSAWGNSPHRPPAGWDHFFTNKAEVSGRSGYVASRVVTDPSETVEVNPWGPGEDSASGARDQAALVVVAGTYSPELRIWGGDIPTRPASSAASRWVVASQMHAVAAVQDEFWEGSGGPHMVAGGRSTEASWSSLHVRRMDSGVVLTDQPTHPQAWASALLRAPDRVPTVSVLREEGEVPARVRPMPRGAQSVDDLLSKRGFVIAHRGGSQSWPEHSMRAYTNAVLHGADALEVSAMRTTDGVWFCCHDRTLKRVDPNAPEKDVWTMSWAEVSQYKTMGEPILRLQDLIDAYGGSHVLVADPKYSASNHAEFVRLFDPKRTIMKFSADATWLADAYRRAGFKSWGYAYGSHIGSGQYAQWAPSWDFLGMEMTESAQPFTDAITLAGGKPVFAHIIPNRSWYDTMMGRGAAGCMVSGVSSVLPEVLA